MWSLTETPGCVLTEDTSRPKKGRIPGVHLDRIATSANVQNCSLWETSRRAEVQLDLQLRQLIIPRDWYPLAISVLR